MNDSLKKNQVYKELLGQIRRGVLAPGEQLPGEAQLAVSLHVSRVTLRAALDLLEEEGLVERVDRKGTFVSRKIGGRNYLAIASMNSSASNPYPYIIPGIEKRLSDAGYHLDSCSPQFIRNLDFRAFRHQLKQNSILGIFLLENNFNGSEPELELLKHAGVPVVVPHGAPEDRPYFDFPLMLPDYRQAFADGVRHLASLGHTRIGTISYRLKDVEQSCRGFSREEYLSFLQNNGLEAAPELFHWTEYRADAIHRTVREMMSSPMPPTAIMCFSDFYAIHVYETLYELNIKIPGSSVRTSFPAVRFPMRWQIPAGSKWTADMITMKTRTHWKRPSGPSVLRPTYLGPGRKWNSLLSCPSSNGPKAMTGCWTW